MGYAAVSAAVVLHDAPARRREQLRQVGEEGRVVVATRLRRRAGHPRSRRERSTTADRDSRSATSTGGVRAARPPRHARGERGIL